MQVASLELCKELYELSGWGETDWAWVEPSISLSRTLPFVAENKVAQGIEDETVDSICVAYDLGYLLRKLKPILRKQDEDQQWMFFRILISESVSPEDAACKLAIELFKQGVLV